MKLRKILAAAMALTVVCGAQTALTGYQLDGGVTANAADIVASGECGENATWQVDSEGTMTISGKGIVSEEIVFGSIEYNMTNIKKLIINEGITEIREEVSQIFSVCRNIESISLPDSLCSTSGISRGVFCDTKWFEEEKAKGSFVILHDYLLVGSNCKGDVIIPKTVKHVAGMAFAGNKELTSVTISDSVTSLGYDAFLECENLEKVSGGSSLSSCGGNVFSHTKWWEKERGKNPLIILQHTLIDGSDCDGNVTITENITSIADYAFCGSEITSVALPKNVMHIGDGAFLSCGKLESAIIFNPECDIYDSYSTFDAYGDHGPLNPVFNGVIKGYKGSTAEVYAKKYGYAFEALEGEPPIVLQFGDPTGDGKIDANDASFVLVEYAKVSTGGESALTPEEIAAADVNGDGKVDAKDASAILAYYSYLSTGGTDTLEAFLKPQEL